MPSEKFSNFICLGCLIWMLEIISASNITSRYMQMDEEQLMRGRFLGYSRKPKFLSFNTLDDDISVEMQFAIPFLTIPIKKSIDTTTGMMNKLQSVNLNLGAIGLAGTIAFGSAFIMPSIYRMFSVKHAHMHTQNDYHHNHHINHNHGLFGRAMDNEYVQRISKELSDKGAPPQECTGRVLCWLVKRSAEAIESGIATSTDKLIDLIASNEWLLSMVENTVFQEAIAFGYSKQDCSAKYLECKLNANALDNLVKNLSSKLFPN